MYIVQKLRWFCGSGINMPKYYIFMLTQNNIIY